MFRICSYMRPDPGRESSGAADDDLAPIDQGGWKHQQTAACDLDGEVVSYRMMIPMALAYASYWRNTLADAELGRGAFRSREVEAFQRIDAEALARGRLGEGILKALFQGDNREAESLGVVLRPLAYRSRSEHGRARVGLPDVLTPIATPATVFRDGRLELGPGTATPRDLLEPMGGGGLTIGAVDALDAFLTGEDDANSASRDWQSYREFCAQLIKAVCPDLAHDDRFERMDYGFLELAQGAKGASQHIVALYDRLREEAPDSPLFENFAASSSPPIEPCLPDSAGFSTRLGHASPRYPLARAQRGALAHLLAARHGEVVTVNGPPGTGKTTLLLSVVASLWADAALRRDEPPVVFAASTNNQAVTNIIDAFGSDFATGEGAFAGRWLPEVTSFAGYFPAASRRGEAAVYQTQAFFDRIEDAEYLERARTAFLNAAAIAFPDLPEPTVEGAVEALHQRLQAQTAELATIEAGWSALCSAREATRALLGESPADVIAALYAHVEEAVAECGHPRSASLLRKVRNFSGLMHTAPLSTPLRSLVIVTAALIAAKIWPSVRCFSPTASASLRSASVARSCQPCTIPAASDVSSLPIASPALRAQSAHSFRTAFSLARSAAFSARRALRSAACSAATEADRRTLPFAPGSPSAIQSAMSASLASSA